ncbi:MAG: hypothetical protein U1G07_09990 [Verrucomicrobiota bacterium]
MNKSLLPICLCASITAGFQSSNAFATSLTVFQDLAGFTSRCVTTSVIDFEGLIPVGHDFSYFGSPGSLSLNGVSFHNNSPLFVQDHNFYGTRAILSAQQTAAEVLLVDLPPGITAISFLYFAWDPIILTLSDGQTLHLAGRTFPDSGFLGFATDHPISSMQFSVHAGLDLDNLRFGQVPDNSGKTATLFALSMASLVGLRRFGCKPQVCHHLDRPGRPKLISSRALNSGKSVS